MSYAIGIDLGTTNSVAAVYRRGRVDSIPIDGRKLLPSVISYREQGQVLVGYPAKSRLFIDPIHSVSSSKRFMGDKNKVYDIYGKKLSPVDVAAEILAKIRVEAGKYLGEEVKDAVITIPAYFTDEQREATRQAGEKAGFNVLRLLSEPTAAAIAYGVDKERDQTIMVYDFGGGTFDVSILKVEKNHFRVLAVDGDSKLGGDDFDEAIVSYLMEQSSIPGSMTAGVSGSIAYQQLKEAAEAAKIELSGSDIADIIMPDLMGMHIDCELHIDTYNRLIQPLLQRSLAKLEEALAAAKLTPRDISRVLLVGGSTRNQAIQKMLTEKIKQPYIADNVDEIVAHGAAIVAASLSTPAVERGVPDYDNTPDIIVEDVTAHSLGINLMMEDPYNKKKLVNTIVHLIEKNTPLPCVGATMGQTLRPHQRAITIGVYRTEETVPRDEDKLGFLSIPVSDQKFCVPAVSLFELDESGLLTFSCAEVPANSRLVKSFLATNSVDLDLLNNMIQNREIHPLKITVNTRN